MTHPTDPRLFAQSLASAAESDMRALEKRKPEIDASLAKFSHAEQVEFKAELSRLMKRGEISKGHQSFRRDWSKATG